MCTEVLGACRSRCPTCVVHLDLGAFGILQVDSEYEVVLSLCPEHCRKEGHADLLIGREDYVVGANRIWRLQTMSGAHNLEADMLKAILL